MAEEYDINLPPAFETYTEKYSKEESRVFKELTDNFEEGKPWVPKTITFDKDVNSRIITELIAGYRVMGWDIRNTSSNTYVFQGNHNLEKMTKSG